jgi:hypothetical protein
MSPLAIAIDIGIGSASVGGASTPPEGWSLDFSDASTQNAAYLALF